MPFDRGPYLSAAFLCEKVLVERDEVKSAIRIFDRTTHAAAGPTPPQQMEPFDYEFALFLRFKSGEARGPMQLRVTLIRPSGESPTPTVQQIYFEGEEDRGVDIVGRMRVRVTMPGVHWFIIHLDDEIVTRVPWRVIYSPVITPQTDV